MYRIYLDANWGCGPVMSGFARYTRGLVDGLSCQPQDQSFDLRFLTDVSPDIEHGSQWVVAPQDRWLNILTSTEKYAYHDLANAEDIRLNRGDALPENCGLFITMHDTLRITHYLMHRDPNEAETYRTKMTQLFRRAEAIIAVSQSSKDSICEQFLTISPEKIHAIYPGIDPLFRPVDRETARYWCSRFEIDAKKPIILNTGAYHPHKNLRNVLYAFALVKEQVPEAQLVLTGAMTPYHAAFWYPIMLKLGIENDVIITGRVTDVDLRYFYSAADVFVYPSLIEGFGLPPVEAEYCGASVIASDIPVFREVLSEQAVLVPPLDYEAWSDAILKVLAQPLDAIGESHPRRQYTWMEAADEYCKLYEAYCYSESGR